MTLDERLDNWGKANRVGGPRPGYCAPWARLADVIANGRQSTPVVVYDDVDAERVTRAWRRLGVLHQRLLKALYITNLPVELICRRLGIRQRPMSIFDLELARAKNMMRQHLEKVDAEKLVNREKSPYTDSDNLIPAELAETAA